MVEKLRFEGIDREIVVDFNDLHAGGEASRYAFDEHRAIISLVSDDGFSASQLLGKLGEHRQSCEECKSDDKETGRDY